MSTIWHGRCRFLNEYTKSMRNFPLADGMENSQAKQLKKKV